MAFSVLRDYGRRLMPRMLRKNQPSPETEPVDAGKVFPPVEFTGQQPGEEGVETYEQDERKKDDEAV
jgi:hypothetical protein